MSSTISNLSTNFVGNGTNVTQDICDKDRDVEKGDVQPIVSVASSICSRPTSSSTSATSTSAEGRVELEAKQLKNLDETNVTWNEVETGADIKRNDTRRVETHGVQESGTRKAGSRTKKRSETNEPSRWKVVGRLLWHAALAMFLTAAFVGFVALLALYAGPLFLVQLLVVVFVAYVVAGGRFRWFYIFYKTVGRDVRALAMYIRVLWVIRGYEKKNSSVADIFRQYVSRHPNKVCFICEDEEWTFQQVEDFSNKIATIFKSHGYRRGDVVALLLENRPEYVAIWLGLCKLGIITPLLNTHLRKASLLHCINVGKCSALIYGTDFTEALSDIADSLNSKLSLYRFGNTSNSAASNLKAKDLIGLMADVPATPPVLSEKASYTDKLLYIYTSGTTGLPKAAVITNSKFMFISLAIHFGTNLGNSDRVYTPLPLYHTAAGVMTIGFALLRGNTIVLRKKFSASAYFSDCIKYNCTGAQYIGEMCRYILAVPPKPEDTQHKVRVMYGNGLRPQIWGEFVERFKIANVAEFYGATEGNANIANLDNTQGAIGFISRILPKVYPISIIKVDADGEPIRDSRGLCQVCKANEPGVFIGKIIPHNPSRAFLGYVDEKASQKKIIHDVFQKGDSAFLSGDILVADELGYLYFKDRTGDTFRWKGENVSTSEVEAVVSNIANYRDCIVYGVEIRGTEGRAGMAAIFDENSSLNIEQLAAGIKEQLPMYARPQFIRILTKIDLTGTFKLKKKDLQDEGFDPRKVQDKLYYLNAKTGYQILTPEIYDQIHEGKVRF